MPNLPSIELKFVIRYPKIIINGMMKRLNVLQVGTYLTDTEVSVVSLQNPVFKNTGME